MQPPRKVTLKVHGVELTLRSDEPVGYLEELARRVSERMSEVGGTTSASSQRAAVMAAITFADESAKEQKSGGRLTGKVRERLEMLLARVDRRLAALPSSGSEGVSNQG